MAAIWAAPCLARVSDNLLKNPSFEGGVDERGVPVGWSLYGGDGQGQTIELVAPGLDGAKAIVIRDGDSVKEIGLMQTVPIEPNLVYEASVSVKGVEGASSAGAYLQLRFLPSNKLFQTGLAATSASAFEEVSVKGVAPPDTKSAVIYLYTHADPTPTLIVDAVKLVSGVEPPPAPAPEPVPPVYTKLKDLRLTTELVRGGKPNVTIIAPASGVYDAQAKRIQQAIEKLTGVRPPIASDEAPAAAVPISGNLIALGNRSTNKTIEELYNRYFTLLDLRYPGPEGYVVRTLHNPFGDGRNVVFVGGSDPVGVNAAADALIEKLKQAGAKAGALTIGRLAEIKLGKGVEIPKDLKKFETWEASAGYGSVGYFGWNSLSKRLAMYYMTGDEFQAREFIRLAFPDAKAKQEIAEIDGERIENKDEPLSGPYHYNAHMMILFWDLVEESPVFTDEERLRVTNAFSKQLNHRKGEGIYGLTEPPAHVGSRHGQWAAISLYCLGRYFQKDYPDPIWAHCMAAAKLHFAPLHEHAWVSGENDNLFWYDTAIAPIFTYLCLTGDREPVKNGVLERLLRAQEMLISGRQPDWALRSASIGYLHKAAYLMQDGRWLTYRDRTGVDLSVFRLGQSFWPDEHLKPQQPDDLVGKWSINHLPKPMWRWRNNGFTLDESFLFGSYRSAPDASGDFTLIDGFNGASRNPYHTFAILELRLNGYTLLRGYRNQVLTRADGLVEPKIAMDAALRHSDVLGDTAIAVGEVPNAAYCNWRRALVQRTGRYALVVDELTFRTDAENVEAQIKWETERAPKAFPDGHIEFEAPTEVGERRNEPGGQVWPSEPMRTTTRGRVATMEWVGPVKEGERKVFFSLVGMKPGVKEGSLGCFRVGENAAVLALPATAGRRETRLPPTAPPAGATPGLVVAGEAEGVEAELAVVAEDHLYGKALRRADVGGALLVADDPVDVDWEFASGMMHVVAAEATRIAVATASEADLRLDGRRARRGADAPTRAAEGLAVIALPEGRHAIEGAKLDPAARARLANRLGELLAAARDERTRLAEAARAEARAPAPALATAMTADVGGPVVDLITVPSGGTNLICAAEGKTVHILTPDGKEVRTLQADGDIRMMRWWKEHQLLLVGCADEQVIAFGLDGKRKWVFTSVMDPAVFRAAKTYWFKSAPGHEGIHGLYTGVFLDGKSQAFVGSACTLEILDENGKLVKRMPQFWGKVSTFAIVPGPDDTLNLLAARKYNGNNTVAIINNKTLDPNPRGFNGVPAGHTYVGGWASMNRHHLFCEDLDGDGAKEIVSEINGTWNRVTVWDLAGRALYDASFGPGERIPARNMRDLDIADLDGDGKKEIVAATSGSLVVALDSHCEKLWATRLESPPTVMKCVAPKGGTTPWIVVGCEDGTVVALNGSGDVVRAGKVNGLPTRITAVVGQDGRPMVVVTTNKGEVKGFSVEE